MTSPEMSAFDESEAFPGSTEQFPTTALVSYLRGQFEDAYNKDQDEIERGTLAQHGSFYKWVPELEGHALTKDSVRIVMKRPHPHDRPGEYTEVFAVYLRGVDGHETADTSGFFADQFLVRSHSPGFIGPWELVTDDGVFPADVGEFDAVGGFGTETGQDPLTPYERAAALLQDLEARNIVASAE